MPSEQAPNSTISSSSTINKVLIANRGEIAVRVIRAARDAGIPSVAVYAEPDANAKFVKLADEAFALGGQTSAESYLVFDKILDAAAKSGANAIHPGYGFLSENADFAQAVLDAGLIWIGPSPQSIRDLGDKVTARHIALKADAPMAPGTKDPVKNADEVVEFAKEYGVPVAIKAAFGGGGRGMKVAYTIEEIPELFESATREAISAFGRGECFVERYLDKARHVEAQVLADTHGNVRVLGTRDCSTQRRFQKLIEEAPAPGMTPSDCPVIGEATAIARPDVEVVLVEPLLGNLPGRGWEIGPYLPFANAFRFLDVQWLFPTYVPPWGVSGSLGYFAAVVAAVFVAAVVVVNRRDA